LAKNSVTYFMDGPLCRSKGYPIDPDSHLLPYDVMSLSSILYRIGGNELLNYCSNRGGSSQELYKSET